MEALAETIALGAPVCSRDRRDFVAAVAAEDSRSFTLGTGTMRPVRAKLTTAPAAAPRGLRTGTCHFATIGSARAYYARQRIDAGAVLDKLEAGEIHIGAPDARPGQRVTLDPSEGRYFIEEMV